MTPSTELNSQILLRCDSFANWNTENPVLGKGEVAVVVLTPETDDLNDSIDTILFKVGDGTSDFSSLGWTSSIAADVYEWAKANARPVYKYGDADLQGFGTAATKAISLSISADAANTEVPTSLAVKNFIEKKNYASQTSTETVVYGDFSSSAASVIANLIPKDSIIKQVEIIFKTPATEITTSTSNRLVMLQVSGQTDAVEAALVNDGDVDTEIISDASALPESFIYNIDYTVQNETGVYARIETENFVGCTGTVYIKYIRA